METSTEDLNEYQWTTEVGAYFPGERAVMHGKDLFSELGDLTMKKSQGIGAPRLWPTDIKA